MNPATARMTPPRPPARLPLAATLKAGIDPGRYFADRLALPAGSALVAQADGYAPKVRCPFHRDQTPSLSLHLETGAWKCFGCDAHGGSVIDFEMRHSKLDFDHARAALATEFRIEAEDPRPPAERDHPRQGRPTLGVVPSAPNAAAGGSLPPPDLTSRPATCPGLGQPSQTWDYRSPTGHFLMAVLRFDGKGKGKSFRPLSWQADPRQSGKATWQFKDPPGLLPLYGLDRLAQRPTAPVLLCEGEKAADAAARLLPGCVTTTTAHGAAAAAKTDYTPLKGRVLRLWPDHDAPGAAYAQEVAHLARAAGAARVEVLDLSSLAMDPTTGTPRPLPKKWDAADALTEGWTPATLAQAARWVAVPAANTPPTALAVNLIRADQLRLTPVTWLWPGWLALGKFHVIAGAPGTGKTTLAMALAATLTSGGRWPDGTRARAADVAIWSGEDGLEDTLAPRLLASGADLRRVHFVHGCSDQDGRRSFDPAHDADLLADAFSGLPSPPALLIVDPIVSAVSGDSHQGSVVRRSLQPLVDMAVARRCAILGISHFSKGTQGRDPTERVTGSLAFGALARVVLVTAKLPSTTAGGRLLARAKNNLGADAGGFCYDLEALELAEHPGIHTTRVLWGKAMEGSARDLLSLAETPDDEADAEGSNRDVEQFVGDCLAGGSLTSSAMQREARDAGYSWDQVKRASVRMGIEKQKQGFKSGWLWTLRREHDAEGSTEGSEGSTQKRLLPSLPSRDSLLSSPAPIPTSPDEWCMAIPDSEEV
ncbi:MAG: AAA family ATPase [Chromatiaceae bacterium]|nr:AAA family ATPase [Chromatiaceae bacterium]